MNSRSPSMIGNNQRMDSICLVEYNHLAENYIRSVVKTPRDVRIVRCSDDGTLPCLGISTQFFLIDAESLPICLSKLVHCTRYSLPESKILVIASDLSIEHVCELVAAGIQGILSHKEVAKYLNRAIHSIMAGRLWLRRDILEQFALYSSSSLALNHRKRSIITPQETRVIALLRRKYSNKEIGAALGIAERTVKFHLTNIFAKVGAHDRTSALHVILRSGFCEPSNAIAPHIANLH
jgi:DNA-binding NarL/FixJ family response regulator